ncbi:MAG: lysylphosphatidylglycerol synthase domain-containing protein [Polyangiaceae bacterium]
MGELIAPTCSSSEVASPTSKLSTVGAERIIDGMILTVILLVGLQTSTRLDPLPITSGNLPSRTATIPAAAYSALVLFFAAFGAMVLFYWRRDLAQRLVEITLNPISPKLAKLVSTRVGHLADGLSFLPSKSHLAEFMGLTLAYWLLNAIATWELLRGCGLNATFSNALVTMGVIGIGILVPAGPGFSARFSSRFIAHS